MSSQVKWKTIAISMVRTPRATRRSPGTRLRTHIRPAQKIALKSAWDTIPVRPRTTKMCSDAPAWSTPKVSVAPLKTYRTSSNTWKPSPMNAPMMNPS